MPEYRRPRLPGGTIRVTVALAGRGPDLPVREIGRLREAGLTGRAGFSPPRFSSTPPRVWTGRNGGLKPALRLAGVRRARKPVRWTDFSAERAKPRRRSRSHPGRAGLRGAYPVLPCQSGEAWLRRAPRGLAVFVGAPRHPRRALGFRVGRASARHPAVGSWIGGLKPALRRSALATLCYACFSQHCL